MSILLPTLHSSTTYFPSTSTTTFLHHSISPKFPSHYPTNKNKISNKFSLHASPENLSPSSVALDEEYRSPNPPVSSASDVVRNFYDGINRRDLAEVEQVIGINCVYEDLVFPRPFVGRKAILDFFGKFIGYISTDLQFVIDAISEEDSSAVGVTWHLEWNGKSFPFSRGCSFYRLEIINGIQQIVYARDCVEPAIKPGESALIIIRGVSWLLQRFPKLVDWF